MRNDDVTPFKNWGKNSVQISYGLYKRFWVDLAYLKEPVVNAFHVQMSYGLHKRFLVDLAYLKEPVVNSFQVVSFMQKKRHFQPNLKQWKLIKHMISKQQFLPEKFSKFNSTLHSDLLMECHIKHIVRKIFASRFCLPPQPDSAMQNHSMLRPGYRSVRFLDTKFTVGTLWTYCHSMCAEKDLVNTGLYV